MARVRSLGWELLHAVDEAKKQNSSLISASQLSHHLGFTPFTRTPQTQNNFLDSLFPILLWIRLCSQMLINTTLVKVINDLLVAESRVDCGSLIGPVGSVRLAERSCISPSRFSAWCILSLCLSYLRGHSLSLFGSPSPPWSECWDVLGSVCERLLQSINSSKQGDPLQTQGPQCHVRADANSRVANSTQDPSLTSKLVYLITLQSSLQNQTPLLPLHTCPTIVFSIPGNSSSILPATVLGLFCSLSMSNPSVNKFHHFKHFKTHNLIASSTFTMLYNHHFYQIPDRVPQPQRNLIPVSSHAALFFFFTSWQPPLFSVSGFAYSGHFIQMKSYNMWPFVAGFFDLA